MLPDLHVRGFKGLRDLQLTELSRVMLVGGKNGVGKTSLLEAIFLFHDNIIFFPSHSQINTTEEAERFSLLDETGRIDRLLDFLRVIEPQLIGLTSVVMPPQKPTVYADIKGTNRKVPVALLGDGMSKLLSIILAIATTDNWTILIDEIDAGFHHSVLPKVWEGIFETAKDFNCQIIATTHSYECLQSAYHGASKAQAEEDFSYIRLESHENNIVAKRYSRAVLGAALEQGWEVR